MKRPWSSPLSRELTVTLAIKLALLIVLWLLFFRPAVDHALRSTDVGGAILGAGPVAPTTTSIERNP